MKPRARGTASLPLHGMFVAAKYQADLTALREKLEKTFWQSNYSDEVSLLLFHLIADIAAIRTNVYFGGRGPSVALRDCLESK